MELIGKREFAKTALDEDFKIFVIYVITLKAEASIYPAQTAQIADLQWDGAPIKNFFEYPDFSNMFSSDLTMELSGNTGINEHTIELIEEKKPLYGPIYAFNLVKLETLKIHIEAHLKTRFIYPSKSPANTSILFDKDYDDNFCLCIDY